MIAVRTELNTFVEGRRKGIKGRLHSHLSHLKSMSSFLFNILSLFLSKVFYNNVVYVHMLLLKMQWKMLTQKHVRNLTFFFLFFSFFHNNLCIGLPIGYTTFPSWLLRC
jgi:hypothetical protein